MVVFVFVQDSDIGMMSSKSPPEEKSRYIPVFRSGSYSEIGPKQYMEDEYICVDNLCEHLGDSINLPSAGAFYGVCNLLLGLINLSYGMYF